MSFTKRFIKSYLIVNQFNKFLLLKLFHFTAKIVIYKERKYLSSSMTLKQWQLNMLYCHYYVFICE